MDYSIVIPVFNCVEYTKKCIESIYDVHKIDKSMYEFEIVVVDNSSTDETPQLLKKYAEDYPNFRYITNDENLGFAKACNIGAKHSNGKYIIFLNNDTEVLANWSKHLMETIQRNDDIFMVGNKCLFPDRTIQHGGIVFTDNRYPVHIYRYLPEDFPSANRERTYNAVTGACFIIEKGHFLSYGGFDEIYINGLEDVDLCLKIRKDGKKIVYQPKSVIIHHESKTPKRLEKSSHNEKIFIERWHDFIQPDAINYFRRDGVLRIIRKYGTIVFEVNRSDKTLEVLLKPESEINEEQEKSYKKIIQLENRLNQILISDKWKITNKLLSIGRKTGLVYIIKGLLLWKRKGFKELMKKVREKLFGGGKKQQARRLSKINSINFDKIKELPISVIITMDKEKRSLFNNFVLPSIKMNKPAEIILVDDEELTTQEKREEGVKQAKHKYVFFCNDRVILPKYHLFKLYKLMESNLSLGYVYTDYQSINITKKNVNFKNVHVKPDPFNEEKLKKENYISAYSLIKKDLLKDIGIGKTTNIHEVWKMLLEKGIKGKYLKDTFFIEALSDKKVFINEEEPEQEVDLTIHKGKVSNKEKLPVSVVVTAIKSREDFTKQFVIPSIEANNPAEIILVDDKDLSNQQKRNKGASLSKQKYIFFCDDDIYLPKNHLKILSDRLDNNPDVGYVYTDYQAIVISIENHPIKRNYYHKSKEFDADYLKYENYISTMSLVRKDVFCGFDNNIKRLQDWDLWLTLLEDGVIGEYVPETGFFAFYIDTGITSNRMSIHEAIRIVREKHNLDFNIKRPTS